MLMLNFRDDPTAFKAFIKEHQDRVYNIVLNRVQNAEDAEEITQDVFVAVFRKPEAFRGESTIGTWLFRIAVNKCIDHLRKEQRRKRWKLAGLFKSEDETTGPKDFFHPGLASENREKTAVLFKALKQLPPNQHSAWVLNEVENMDYKQISELMNLSISSVESLLFRARRNLRKKLDELYPGDH